MRRKQVLGVFTAVVLFFVLFNLFYSFAEEKITLTTYYPAPYGVYKELRADQMSIGSGYRNIGLADGLLIVNGSVGIGLNNTWTSLDVRRSGVNSPAFLITNSLSGPGTGNFAFMVPELGSGGYNPLSQPGDSGIFYADSGGFVIGPWSGLQEGIRIGPTGIVGIATGQTDLSSVTRYNPGPGYLHLFSAGEALLQVSNNNDVNPYSDSLILRRTPGWGIHEHGILFADSNSMQAAIRAKRVNGAANYKSSLFFFTQNTGLDEFQSDTTVKMAIDGDGNVGIGTTNPLAKLEVNGTLVFTDSGKGTSYCENYPYSGTTYCAAGYYVVGCGAGSCAAQGQLFNPLDATDPFTGTPVGGCPDAGYMICVRHAD